MPRRPLTSRANSGMTMLEIMVVLAVIGLMMVFAYMGVRQASKSDLRENVGQLAAMLKNAQNMAAETGMHHRVVIDLEEQSFRVEACKGAIRLRRTSKEIVRDFKDDRSLAEVAQDNQIPPEIMQADSPEKATELAAALTGKNLGGARCGLSTRANGDSQGRGNLRKMDPRHAVIKRVHVQHLEDPVTEGTVTINFFPLGNAEKAIIEIAEKKDKDTYWTLLLHGLTARVEWHRGELDDANEHMMRDAAGEKVMEREVRDDD